MPPYNTDVIAFMRPDADTNIFAGHWRAPQLIEHPSQIIAMADRLIASLAWHADWIAFVLRNEPGLTFRIGKQWQDIGSGDEVVGE